MEQETSKMTREEILALQDKSYMYLDSCRMILQQFIDSYDNIPKFNEVDLESFKEELKGFDLAFSGRKNLQRYQDSGLITSSNSDEYVVPLFENVLYHWHNADLIRGRKYENSQPLVIEHFTHFNNLIQSDQGLYLESLLSDSQN
ncbi:MAG: hypothetical protein ACI83O_000665 [Patescibacteria group bacterium]|jgi:hypothetical protein